MHLGVGGCYTEFKKFEFDSTLNFVSQIVAGSNSMIFCLLAKDPFCNICTVYMINSNIAPSVIALLHTVLD